MSYLKRGKIISISDIETGDKGWKKLTYRIDTGEEWNPIWEFIMFKGEKYAEHVDKFIQYNNVGDEVEVEFNIKPRVWEEKDRVFTDLEHWKITKVGAIPEGTIPSASDLVPSTDPLGGDDSDSLPF